MKSLLFISFIFFIALTSALQDDITNLQSYNSHKVNTDLTISLVSANSTSCKLTSILLPDGTQTIINLSMTKSDKLFYLTIDSGNYSLLGPTCHLIECDSEVGSVCREVNYNGENIESYHIYIYIIALLFLVLLILGANIFINKLPADNAKDEAGAIIQVNQLKHLRKVLWIFIWTISLAILFIISNIAFAYLPNQMVGQFFLVLYKIMFYFTLVMVPLAFIWTLYKMYKDAEFQRMIERGVDIGDI